MTPILIAVMGPTASGKTALAEALADDLGAQLVNADAFQVYRGMDVGTAKPAARDRYLFLDLRDPNEGFGVGEFTSLAQQALAELYAQGRHVVVVGGTGLYIRALLEEYSGMAAPPDPELRASLNRLHAEEGVEELARRLIELDPDAAARIDIKNPARVKRAIERATSPTEAPAVALPPFRRLKVALSPEPAILEQRITLRVEAMVQNGWVQEVERLVQAGYGPDDPGFRAIGYRQIWRAMAGEVELEEAVTTTIVDTKRYAKRQRTWLRSEPNLSVLDLDPDPLAVVRERIRTLFA
jgi:tRNA dimethylallyltransferase